MNRFINFVDTVPFPSCASSSSGCEQGQLRQWHQGGTRWRFGKAGPRINYLFDWFYLFRWECCFSPCPSSSSGREQASSSCRTDEIQNEGLERAGAGINYLLNRFIYFVASAVFTPCPSSSSGHGQRQLKLQGWGEVLSDSLNIGSRNKLFIE